MENKVLHLTQEMVNENPKLTGFFQVREGNVIIDIGRNQIVSPKEYIHLKNGMLHNENGPAYITNSLKGLIYFINGNIKAWPEVGTVEYDLEGSIIEGKYITNPSAKPNSKQYFDNLGELHSLSGPAIESHGENTEKLEFHSQYYIHGIKLTRIEWKNHHEVIEYLGKINLKEKMKKEFS